MEYNLGHHNCHRQHHGPSGEGHGHESYQQVSLSCAYLSLSFPLHLTDSQSRVSQQVLCFYHVSFYMVAKIRKIFFILMLIVKNCQKKIGLTGKSAKIFLKIHPIFQTSALKCFLLTTVNSLAYVL